MSDQREIIVTDIRMPFWSMVRFLVKLAIASIPAFIILWLLALFVLFVFGAVGFVWFPWGTFQWGTGSGTLGTAPGLGT